MRNDTPAVIGLALLLAAALSLPACGAGTPSSNCDPQTITASGRCFWEKDQACDAIGCLPPNECVVVEGKPAKVECHKH
ncbi:MAG TPA: hypothetical protein VHB21_04485 [Minicystis sp.]|nr:hypothetical protein [Minicystis sp.]